MKNQISENREMVIKYIQHSELINEEQINFILALFNGLNKLNKDELLKLSGYTKEQCNKVDSAYPQPYADQIREIYPNFKNGSYCFDYNKAIFGELVNINDLLINKLRELF
jgi:hypothetical protein